MMVFRWLGVLSLLALCACNTVYSERPLFSAEDAVGSAPLKPGLWVEHQPQDDDQDCRFDPSRPIRQWPDCVRWVLVREGDMLQFGSDGKTHLWIAQAYILAGGQPRILQTTDLVDLEAQEGTTQYVAVVPTRYDDRGRISSYRTWTAQCGPPDRTEYPEGSGPHPTTLAPLPGVIMSEDGNSCEVRDRETVRQAIIASEAWDERRVDARWIRDPRPDDFARGRREKRR